MLFQGIDFRRTSFDELTRLLKDGKILFNKPAFKELQDILEYGMTKPSFKDALHSLFLILTSGNEKYIKRVKTSGILRYSQYINQRCIIASVISELLNYEKNNSYLRGEDKEYLTALYLLKGASGPLNESERDIVYFIKKNIIKFGSQNLLKFVLAYIDHLFLPILDKTATEILKSFFPKTKEDIAESASYLIYKISTTTVFHIIPRRKILYNYHDFIIENDLEYILKCASIIIQIKEWEIYIESFGYHFKEEDNKLIIEPPYQMLEKSIRLGYIRTELQYDNCLLRTQAKVSNSAISLVEYAATLQKSLGEHFIFEYKEDFGYCRFVLQFPDYVADVLKKQLFDSDTLFKEDYLYLSLLGREQLITNDTLGKTFIPNPSQSKSGQSSLSLKEFLKIRNLFVILNIWMTENLRIKANGNLNIIYNSSIPIFSKETLIKLLTKITSEKNAQLFLDITSWSPESNYKLDIQYTPFICLDNYYAMPLNIFANSNSIRNLYASMHKSNGLVSDGQIDSLIQMIQDTFNYSNNPCIANTPYSDGDIDIIAKVDNSLLVLECKNTLHPTSAHDMRTTWDHITKGQQQLQKIQNIIESQKLDSTLQNKFGVKSSELDTIYYAMIISNRLFNGNYLSYPVRSVNDFVNLLHDGIVITPFGEYCQWESTTLSANDIYNYFYDNHELKILENCLVPVRIEHTYIQPTILKYWNCLDKEMVTQQLKKEYESKVNR